MIQVLDKYGKTHSEEGNVVVLDKYGNIKRKNNLTKTSQLINDGSDGTSFYLQQTDLNSSNIISGLGFTPEDVANKATDFTTINDTLYPTVEAVKEQLDLKVDKVTTSGAERAYTINADGSQGIKPTSDFKDVIEGYFNGTNFYTDALFTNLITPESGKIYINIAVTPSTQYRWSGSAYVQIGGGDTYNPSFWLVDKLVKTSSTNFVNAALNGGNFFGGSSPNTASFKTMLGVGIMSGTNANGGGRYKIEPANALRVTTGLSFYSCFNLANTTRDNVIKIGFFNTNENVTPVTDGFWLQINGVNATLNTANGAVTSQSSSSPLTTTYMECLVEYVSSTEVKCKVKELLTGNVVFNQTLTTNIPTTAKTFGCGLIATITTAGASNTICSIQELSFGIKPNFLNNF